MPDYIFEKKDILLPVLPDVFKDLKEVRKSFFDFQRAFKELLDSGKKPLDEDDLVSDDAEVVASQQSIKAYVDSLVRSADERIKGWIQFDGTGTIAILDSFNVSGITDNGTGHYTVTWDTDFTNDDYAILPAAKNVCADYHDVAVGSVGLRSINYADPHVNEDQPMSVIAIGDQ